MKKKNLYVFLLLTFCMLGIVVFCLIEKLKNPNRPMVMAENVLFIQVNQKVNNSNNLTYKLTIENLSDSYPQSNGEAYSIPIGTKVFVEIPRRDTPRVILEYPDSSKYIALAYKPKKQDMEIFQKNIEALYD